MTLKTLSRLALLALAASLAACSVFESDKIDYKSAGKVPTLEVPPDLTQLTRDNRYAIPGGAVSANAMQAGMTNAPSAPTAVNAIGDVRLERNGTQRWLVVNRAPDQIWDSIRDFWQENGFLLTTDQRNIGIMETDWAENRAKLPQDIIRGTLGKLVDSVYSTGELDRFRTRLEQSGGSTEIFVSHRGMTEVYSNSAKDQTIWQPRPADPELETEFLRRLMVKLGVSQEQSKALVAAGGAPASQRATVSTDGNGMPTVRINENFDRAWRRVGLTLDRTGFTVEDRDRAAGTYFVRYVPPDRKEPGTWAKLITFGQAGKDLKPLKLRVQVKSQGDLSTVSVLNEAGAPDNSESAKKIVQVIADDMK
ncbi:outer membrane protein assembly factor BamC [Variovorax sp. OV329]|uniref:outer membrane protein assembly factor BamC n=1 Tax=Variovorax sp. OV329 TaxID=1882825 RepID=UPI0008F3B8F8|nr:outer membrane protein assembly factor BamC [Variovorax sp. OV329]SFN45771.1 Beta-barrel assembly machine subunit BamC [Variovorax sp. OV329]